MSSSVVVRLAEGGGSGPSPSQSQRWVWIVTGGQECVYVPGMKAPHQKMRRQVVALDVTHLFDASVPAPKPPTVQPPAHRELDFSQGDSDEHDGKEVPRYPWRAAAAAPAADEWAWTALSPLNIPRLGHNAVAADGWLYVLGGHALVKDENGFTRWGLCRRVERLRIGEARTVNELAAAVAGAPVWEVLPEPLPATDVFDQIAVVTVPVQTR
jgi:hypothetical protein